MARDALGEVSQGLGRFRFGAARAAAQTANILRVGQAAFEPGAFRYEESPALCHSLIGFRVVLRNPSLRGSTPSR